MPIRPIPVSGGLVTSKDPSLLAEGELARADDAEYLPNNPGLWKVKGRTAFNSSAESSAILGGRFLQFDGGMNLFVTLVGTVYRKATAGLTGSFSDVQTGLAGTATTLDSTHYNNSHYLMNGVDRNYVVDSTGAATLHGMLAATTAPTVASTGSGTGFTLSSGSTIIYWVEEQVRSGSSILRRSASSSSATVTLTGTGALVKPVVTKPATLNSDATHWEVYATATGSSFPVGASIGSAAIGTTTIEDLRTGTDPAIPSGSTYDTVSVSLAGTTSLVPKHGPPPIASTGDVFEDSIVCDDSADRSRLRYCFSDSPHDWPSNFFIRFETKEADIIKLVRALNNSIVVCLQDSLWRVDTLPRPEDAAFQIDRVKSLIQGAQGCVGPMAGCVFSFGEGLRLAYVSKAGILVTDGNSWDVLTDDVDWENTVTLGSLSSSVLINNGSMYRLEFYYTPTGGTANTKALYLHYHPSHAKRGEGGGLRAKVTGPINVSANAAFMATISSQLYAFTANPDGKLYQERSGASDTSGAGGIAFVCKTGDVYPSGVGNSAMVKQWWVHHSAGASSQTATAKLTMRAENQTDVTATESIPLDMRELTSVRVRGQGEAFAFEMDNSDSTGSFSVNYFVADTKDLQRGVERD